MIAHTRCRIAKTVVFCLSFSTIVRVPDCKKSFKRMIMVVARLQVELGRIQGQKNPVSSVLNPVTLTCCLKKYHRQMANKFVVSLLSVYICYCYCFFFFKINVLSFVLHIRLYLKKEISSLSRISAPVSNLLESPRFIKVDTFLAVKMVWKIYCTLSVIS